MPSLHFLASQIDTNVSLTANSDTLVPSQKAVRAFVLANVGGGGTGDVTQTGVQTLTNKTMSGSSNTFSNISADSIIDGTTNKAYTAIEKTKLFGISSGATANSSDATLLSRSNHTGTQAIGTITGLQSILDSKSPLDSPSFTGIPTVPTAAANTNTTQIATTAFVLANIPTSYFDMTQYSGDGKTEATKVSIAYLSGSVITSGTVADARLSTNIPLKNGSNTFTGANTFGDLNASNLIMAGGILSNNTSDQYALYSSNNAGLRVGKGEFNSFIELFTANAGIYMKSPNGTRYKFGVSDAGVAVFTAAP